MAVGDGERDSAGERLNRARGGAGQVRGKARELGREGLERGRRVVAGATPAAGSAHSARHELEEGEEGEGKTMLGAASG